MKYIVHTDGGARGNPGPAGIGFVIADEKGVALKKVGKYIGEATNNVAEYEALIHALTELKKVIPKEKRKESHVDVHMDSELVVKQLNGEYQIKEEPLQLLFVKVWNLRVSEFPNITFTHVMREDNSVADALYNKALDEHYK
jgi:ribonuclease HI